MIRFMEKLNIKIPISNRLYPMYISASEEKTIRLSASRIQKMLESLKDRYSVKDDQDLLAMCALQLCVKIEKLESSYMETNKRVIMDIENINKNIKEIF